MELPIPTHTPEDPRQASLFSKRGIQSLAKVNGPFRSFRSQWLGIPASQQIDLDLSH